jgi:hypothetical protein
MDSVPVHICPAVTSFGFEKEYSATLAELLKEWRIATASSTQASRRCGISPQLWFQLETGETKRPLMSTLERVSQGTASL